MAPRGCQCGHGAGLVGLVTGQQKATHVHSLAGPHAQHPVAAAEAAFGRSRQSLPSPALTRAALPHTAIRHPRKPGPGEATVGRGHRRREGPAGPGPASDRRPAPLASGPGPRPGKELAHWTGGGHASKTAPKLELEGPSARAPLRPRGTGGGAQGPQAGGRPGRDLPYAGCRGALGGRTRPCRCWLSRWAFCGQQPQPRGESVCCPWAPSARAPGASKDPGRPAQGGWLSAGEGPACKEGGRGESARRVPPEMSPGSRQA